MKSVYANQIGRNFFKLSTQSTPGGETVSFYLVGLVYVRLFLPKLRFKAYVDLVQQTVIFFKFTRVH